MADQHAGARVVIGSHPSGELLLVWVERVRERVIVAQVYSLGMCVFAFSRLSKFWPSVFLRYSCKKLVWRHFERSDLLQKSFEYFRRYI